MIKKAANAAFAILRATLNEESDFKKNIKKGYSVTTFLWKFYIFATLKDIFALYEISKSKESSGSMARFATIDGKG